MVTRAMLAEAKPFTGASETAVRMMLRYPWFMVLYYSMSLYEVRWPKSPYWHQTLGTNGVSLWVDPDFWAQLSRDHKLTAVAHELGHKMLLHPTRRHDRHPIIWNIAGDYVINLMLVESGFKPLDGMTINGKPWKWFYDVRFKDMTTEQVYDIISQEYQDQADAAGEGEGDSPDGEGSGSPDDVGGGEGKGRETKAGRAAAKDIGSARDLVDFGETPQGKKDEGDGRAQESERDFEQRVRQELKTVEQMSKMAGNTPSWLKRLLDNADHQKVPWHEILAQHIKALVKTDYSWSRWSRREWVKTGVISPDMYTPAMGGIVVYTDCSGSCWDDLPMFNMHFKDIVEMVKPAWVVVKYFQTYLQEEDTERFERGDPEVRLKPTGGGGTSFGWLKKDLDEMEEPPEVAIVLTDMEADFSGPPESVPVIWASVSHIEQAPFGEVVVIH